MVGSDFSEAMLDRARAKARAPARRAPAVQPRFEWADALALPYADDSFDAATVGFGARNFADLGARPAGDGARRAPGRAGGGARDHHPHARAAVALLPRVVRPPRAGAGARSRALWRAGRVAGARGVRGRSPTPTPTCRTRSSASRRPAGSPRRWSARGSCEIGYLLTGRRHRRDPRRHRAIGGGTMSTLERHTRPAAPAGGGGRARGDHAPRRARAARARWRAPSATSSG